MRRGQYRQYRGALTYRMRHTLHQNHLLPWQELGHQRSRTEAEKGSESICVTVSKLPHWRGWCSPGRDKGADLHCKWFLRRKPKYGPAHIPQTVARVRRRLLVMIGQILVVWSHDQAPATIWTETGVLCSGRQRES